MDGVGTPIIGRPRPLPGHDTPNPAYHPHTLNYEEPVMPLAVVALLIGLILGLIATWVNYRLVKAGAYRRARNLRSYLNSRVEDVLQAKLYARLESHIAEHVSLMALANALAE